MQQSYALVTNSVAAPALWPGGQGVLVGQATSFGGATVTLQVLSADGVTYLSTAATLSANGLTAAVNLPQGLIRALISGGAPTALNVYAAIIPTNLN